MALLSDSLTVWEIAHRWAGFDPVAMRIRIPLQVRDWSRTLIDAILNAEIDSTTLQIRKWKPEDGADSQKYFIRHHIDEVYACIWGKKFSRPLLKQASIDRFELKLWCEAHSVPLPEFWFPPGWGLSYEWQTRDAALDDEGDANVSGQAGTAARPSTLSRIACQQIAQSVWREEPSTTIADMVKHQVIQQYGGAAVYSATTVREWLSAVAPADVKNKRGRPRKKPDGGDRPKA